MFEKVVVIDYTGLTAKGREQLKALAKDVVYYDTVVENAAECIRRIGDADAVLVSFTTRIGREVIEACPRLRYVGMCCSLYSEASANVDIVAARERGIVVLGIRDYGDEGVPEFVVSELVRLLHGFGGRRWREQAYELSGLKAGIIGLGRTGRMIADALRFFGAEVYYYGPNRKPEAEKDGIGWLPKEELLEKVDIVGTCLPRNTIVLGEREFEMLGHNKILFNASIGVTFDVPALEHWLADKDNFYMCDRLGMGDYAPLLAGKPNVIFRNLVSGHSAQCWERLSRKVIENIETFLASSGK